MKSPILSGHTELMHITQYGTARWDYCCVCVISVANLSIVLYFLYCEC